MCENVSPHKASDPRRFGSSGKYNDDDYWIEADKDDMKKMEKVNAQSILVSKDYH